MTKATAKKLTKSERQAALRTPKPTKGKRGKKAEVHTIQPEAVTPPAPKATKSVVQPTYKAKATKSGIWRDDKINDAVRSAFLAETGTPAECARAATDAILSENGLDAGRWANLNAGMLSMNLRNVLRGLLRNDGVVFVRGKKIEA